MTCNRCGAPNAVGARFCNTCGDRLDVGSGSSEATATFEVPVVQSAAPVTPIPTVATPPAMTATPARRSVWRRPAGAAQVGVVLMVGSAFLPWLSTPGIAALGTDLPLAFLWDLHAPEDVLTLGILMFALAGLSLVGAVLRPLDVLGRLAGGLAVVAAGVMVYQWRRFLGDMGIEQLTLGFIGIGAYAAAGGGLASLISMER